MTDDSFAELTEATVAQYELYRSWIASGFTEEQALELFKAVISAFARGAAGC